MNVRFANMVCLAALSCLCISARAQDYASSSGTLLGKKIVLKAHLFGVSRFGGPEDQKGKLCIPVGSELSVFNQDKEKIFFTVARWAKSVGACQTGADQYEGSSFSAPQQDWASAPRLVTGVSFGGLVVPFKYRLGGTKTISSSATVAPYVGWDLAWAQKRGITLTPLVSAGLALVPVTDPQTGKTETRPAMSLLTGFRLSSAANASFTAGLVVGRDFLSSADRKLDPTVNKTWLSLYLGYAI